MDSYKEYPIRCKTCNEPLACFALDYEEKLRNGITIEKALDELGIIECQLSRSAMMNPTVVTFNMENRQTIEGLSSIEAINENTSLPIFATCTSFEDTQILETLVPTRTSPTSILGGIDRSNVRVSPIIRTTNIPSRMSPIIQTTTGPARISSIIQTTTGPTRMSPIIQTTTGPTRLLPISSSSRVTSKTNEIPLAPYLDIQPGVAPFTELEEKVPLGEGITPEEGGGDTEIFHEPVLVGVPTINRNRTIPLATVYVGANKNAEILNGRTYIAQ